jgi:hypothetical protein
VFLLGAAYVAFVFARWRSRPAMERVLVVFALAYFVMLCPVSLQAGRYMLPVTAALSLLGALAATLPARRPGGWRGRVLAGLLLAVCFVWQARLTLLYDRQFATDSRTALLEWVLDTLPPGSHVAQDAYAGLPDPVFHRGVNDPLALPLVTKFFIADLRSLAEARARGITHIAACSMAYDRFFDPGIVPVEAEKERYERRRRFYETLFAEGELLWHKAPARDMEAFTHPEIRLYRIAPPEAVSP